MSPGVFPLDYKEKTDDFGRTKRWKGKKYSEGVTPENSHLLPPHEDIVNVTIAFRKYF